MSGFRQSPIQQIRNDLRERYKGGFTILKELLQNADDAGAGTPGASASELVLLLTPGIPKSRHVLLHTPGLCLVNDGDFTVGDAISISSYGSSIRGGQAATVGRFGLGLKSVFHWAEAFFYFSPARFTEEGETCPASDVLNPWISRETGQGLHMDWDEQWSESKEHDYAQFEATAHSLLKSERWFGLWIPFRIRTLLLNAEPVFPEWPLGADGQAASYETLFGPDWELRVSEVLPLLRRLRRIRFCCEEVGVVNEVFRLAVEEPARRMSFLAGNGHEFQPGLADLHGKVSIRKGEGVPQTVSFAGREMLPGTATAAPWQDNKFWPRPFVQTENGGEEPRPEKAAEHGAVAFVRQRAAKGQVRIQPAVFLPLGEPEMRPIKGEASYAIFLHGHFFVDSGRRDIDRFDDLAADTTFETVGSEEELRKLWNRTLMRDVVAPLVLPSLDAFVRQEQMDVGDVEMLVEAMEKSKTLKPLTPWMCRGQRFILRLLQTGSAWERQTWNDEPSRWLKLPAPDFPEVELFDFIPALAPLSSQVVVSLEGKPHLADYKQNTSPTDEELAGLLSSVPVSVFSAPKQLAYVLMLIQQNASERKLDSPLTIPLNHLANNLLGNPLPQDEALARLWKQFLKQIPLTAFVRLPVKSTEARPEISCVLADSKLPVALLWQDFRDTEGRGSIAWLNLLPVLKAISELAHNTDDAYTQRSLVAVRLLETSAGKPADWAGDIRHLALFAAHEPEKSVCVVNFGDLQGVSAEGLLFSDAQPFAKDLAKAAPDLKPLMLQMGVAKLLNLHAPECNAVACVPLLGNVARLAADFSSRKPLFERLLQATRSDDADFWAPLRCLLHGEINAWKSTLSLFDETGAAPVTRRLLEMALTAANQPWRSIAASVAGQIGLTAQQRQQLGLVPASEANVATLMREIGPTSVDCVNLPKRDCDYILLHFDDLEVLRGLNIHETVDGRRVRIDEHTYVDNGSFKDLPDEFNAMVTRLRDRLGYARFLSADGFRPLSWEAVIKTALCHPNPEQRYDVILTAIGKADYLRAELRDQIVAAAWLPLTGGGVVKPSDVLHIRGAESELDKLPPNVLNGRVPLLRLLEGVRKHERFERFKGTMLAAPEEAMKTLALLLQRGPAWSTGLCGEWTGEEVAAWVNATENAPDKALPVAPLVKVIYGETTLRGMLPSFLQDLSGQLNQDAYVEILKFLAAGQRGPNIETCAAYNQAFAWYLEAIVAQGKSYAFTVLRSEGIELRSATGEWKSPALLAFSANGISQSDILCDDYAAALGSSELHDQTQGPPGPAFQNTPGVGPQSTSAVLQEYFTNWTGVPRPLIGVFLAILGGDPAVKRLAQAFLGPHSFSSFREEISSLDGQGRLLGNEIERYQFRCSIVSDNRVQWRSVTGALFQASRAQPVTTLLLGDGAAAFALAGNPFEISFRLAGLDGGAASLGCQKLADMLRETTRQVLKYVFCRASFPINAMWKRFAETGQLHILIAQQFLLRNAIALLRQVGAGSSEKLKPLLKKWDAANNRRAEERFSLTLPRRAEQMEHQAIDELRQALESDAVHEELLHAVRRTVQRFRYDEKSVVFELWQNADDAYVQAERLCPARNGDHPDAFVIVQRGTVLAFLHWGRPINQFRGESGFDGRDAGFDHDLHYMLTLNLSEKDSASGPTVTGKFGLGFKSVLLIADAPKVVSGEVDFAVQGGLYPKPLKPPDRSRLEGYLDECSPDGAQPGTVIELQLSPGQLPNPVLEPFRELLPVLLAFSRRIKQVVLVSQEEATFRWIERSVPGVEGVLFGRFAHPVGEATGALILQRGEVKIMLGMNADGITPLPANVPVFWVTAPTRDTLGYGFAVNGPFEPDAGRIQLASNSNRNVELAAEVGGLVGSRLESLWRSFGQNWQAMRTELELPQEHEVCRFWEGLWKVLGSQFAQACPKNNDAVFACLARRMLWQSKTDGLWHFYEACAALPTGLSGGYRALTRLPDVHFSAMGALDREAVFRVVSGWPVFRKEVPVGHICSNTQVVSTLERLGVHLDAVEPVYLSNAVKWELGEGRRADPELAARLGLLITVEFLKNLREGKPGGPNEQEHTALNALLANAEFQAADGSWHKVTQMVVAAEEGVGPEEKQRAAFAPQGSRLNPAYTGDALAFFIACRPRLESNVDTMAAWVLQAGDEDTRVSALRYLLSGELKDRLAEELRRQRDDRIWLWQLQSSGWFKQRFPDEKERHEILSHCLRLFEDKLRQWAQEQQQAEAEGEEAEIQHQPWTVRQLWLWWERQGKPKGDYTLEGEANWELFHGGAILEDEQRKAELKRLLQLPGDPDGNSLWYRLFAYACLVSAGRTMTELRDFWKYQLNPRQFWERTSAGDFSESTQEIFDQAVTTSFTNMAAGGEQAYFWRRVFYDVRKVHRMVQNEFPAVLLNLVNQGHGEHLRQFLRTGDLPGPDQRPWIGTFGQSADTPLGFIIRELVRLEVITDEAVRPYAFYVCRPVLRALAKIGWIADVDSGFSGESWLTMLQTDPENGIKLMVYYDIPLLHLGITHRGDKMPRRPE